MSLLKKVFGKKNDDSDCKVIKFYCTVEGKTMPEQTGVIFNDPATIVYWGDGTKTVVKCQNDDEFDPEKGLALCYMKKICGNTGRFNDVIKKALKENDCGDTKVVKENKCDNTEDSEENESNNIEASKEDDCDNAEN